MASSNTTNVIARRTINEITEFSGETETLKYMKVFILQEIAKARIREDKLRGSNEAIVAAEEEISTLETHLEMIDAAINSE
ncbi:hypothetical protein Tco_0796222 [Tanacetum coccineum]